MNASSSRPTRKGDSLSNERVIDACVCHHKLVVMATTELYEASGDWLHDVGLPANIFKEQLVARLLSSISEWTCSQPSTKANGFGPHPGGRLGEEDQGLAPWSCSFHASWLVSAEDSSLASRLWLLL
jgi:Glutaminase